MLNEKIMSQLQEMGATRWTKGEHDRLYLNEAAAKLIGLEISYYNTGNISYAKLDGEKISNRRAGELSAVTSIYININTGKMAGRVSDHQIAMIREKLDEMEAEI